MKLIERVRETAKVLKTLSHKPRRQPPKRLQARVRAATTAAVEDYEDEEPQTKLTSAFVVVLILHIVAVGGIYAFNEIKASRKGIETARVSDTPKTTHPVNSTTPTTPVEAPAVGEAASSTAVASIPAAIAPTLSTKPRTYTVKPGDTLHGIAKTFGMSVNDLKAANGLTTDGIRQGQTLSLVSMKAGATPHADPLPEKTEPAEAKPPMKTYTVKGGDRLIFIAKRFNVSQEDLIAANKIKDPAKLQIGQTLKIPTKK